MFWFLIGLWCGSVVTFLVLCGLEITRRVK